MKEEDSKFYAGIAVALFVLFGFPLMAVAFSAISGFALMYLWTWFIVPTFHVVALSFWQAVGVSFIVRHLTHSRGPKEEKFWRPLFEGLVLQGITLWMGYVIHLLAAR